MALKKTIQILERFLNGKATIEEEARIDKWYESIEEPAMADKDMEGVKEVLYQRIRNELETPARVVPMYKRKIFKYVAAACIIGLVGVLANVWWKHNDKTPQQVAIAHDVPAPSNTRAVITLANGQKVYLDSVNNGTIAQENNVNVVKNKEGGIVYLSPAGGGDLSATPNNKRPGVDYNTLSNPRGSKVISLTLSDGTKVWLNSESSLKYPIAFNANTREVEITGEAYFEVKHNAKQPFKVHLPNGSIVEDIGTSFNVNAYTDEEAIKTTLIEGSVKVVTGVRGPASRDPRQTPGMDNSITLKPGQQVILTRNSQPITHNPDLDEVTAWKNGRFSFKSTDIKAIMRDIARWYDVEVNYEGAVPNETITGDISRDVNVSQVMKMMEFAGFHFRIEGKKITVIK